MFNCWLSCLITVDKLTLENPVEIVGNGFSLDDDDMRMIVLLIVDDNDWSTAERTALWWWKDEECFLSWMSVKGKRGWE